MLKTALGWLKGKKYFAAVDLGATGIKIAQLKKESGRISVEGMHSFPVPSGMLNNWLNGKEDKLAAVLAEAAEKTGLRGGQVITSLSGANVITRHLQMPAMPDREIKKAVNWEAKRFIPVPLNDMIIRYVKLEEAVVEGVKKVNLLLAACSSEFLHRFYKTFKKAGLVISAVDLQPFALWRVFTERQWGSPSGGTAAIVDIGATFCHVVVVREGKIRYTRNFPVEINNHIKEQNLRELATELRRSLVFYKKYDLDSPVGSIVLSGGGSKITEIKDYVAEQVDAKVEIFKHFEPAFMVAVGLALREAVV